MIDLCGIDINNRGWTGENYFVLIYNDPIDTERSKSTSLAFNLLSTSNDNFCRKGDADHLLSCFCGKGVEVLGTGIDDVVKIDSSNLIFFGGEADDCLREVVNYHRFFLFS